MWVATMIMKVAKVKPRARMMAKFVKIGEVSRREERDEAGRGDQ